MDRTDKSNQKAGKECRKGGQTGGARLVGKKTEQVCIDPDTVMTRPTEWRKKIIWLKAIRKVKNKSGAFAG